MSIACRLCGNSNLVSVLDLGASPPCESFLSEEQLDQPEVTYPLHLRLCPDCLLLQIPALITPEETFGGDYAYYSSCSVSWSSTPGGSSTRPWNPSDSARTVSSWRWPPTTATCSSTS